MSGYGADVIGKDIGFCHCTKNYSSIVPLVLGVFLGTTGAGDCETPGWKSGVRPQS